MSAPDSLRDTLAHALLGTPNVSVYGVGDDKENALTAADFMLREYDWPWLVAGPALPKGSERDVLVRVCLEEIRELEAVMKSVESLGDEPHPDEHWMERVVRTALGVADTWPGGTVAPGGPVERDALEQIRQLLVTHYSGQDPLPVEAQNTYVYKAWAIAAATLARGSVPGGSPTGERD